MKQPEAGQDKYKSKPGDSIQPVDSGKLLAAMYQELRALAEHRLARESAGDLPQPTSIVHEAYLKILGDGKSEPQWQSHGHFFAAAAEAMRQILVDRARKRKTQKHGGGRLRVHLTSVVGQNEPHDEVDMERLDRALTRLESIDRRMADIVKLRFFAGLTIAQSADVIGISEKTVERDWVRARAWLINELKEPEHAPE